MQSYYKRASGAAKFQCFGVGSSAEMAPVLLDWDNKFGQSTIARVYHDLAIVMALLPEAGEPVLYRTGHGIHVIFTQLVKMVDYQAMLDFVHGDYAGDRYTVHSAEGPNEFGGTACSGFCATAYVYGPTLRVGRKEGRGRDIFRITPRAYANSPLVDTHDAMVRHYSNRPAPAVQGGVEDLDQLVARLKATGIKFAPRKTMFDDPDPMF